MNATQSAGDEEERLSRFLTSTRQFAATKGRVKASAFMPAPDLNLSVFVTTGIGDEATWSIANFAVADRTVYGRGEVSLAIVAKQGLSVVRDDVPERHANVTGWPSDKDAQKELAQALAAQATLVMR